MKDLCILHSLFSSLFSAGGGSPPVDGIGSTDESNNHFTSSLNTASDFPDGNATATTAAIAAVAAAAGYNKMFGPGHVDGRSPPPPPVQGFVQGNQANDVLAYG